MYKKLFILSRFCTFSSRKRKCQQTLTFFTIIFAPHLAWAANEALSLGVIAKNLVGSELEVKELLQIAVIIAGVGFILGGLIQFRKYLRNPVEVTLTTVIVTILLGVALILISFIPIQF